MLPELLLLLLAKALTLISATKAEMDKAGLQEYLKAAQQARAKLREARLQAEVDSTVALLRVVHAILVLIQAAVEEFGGSGKMIVAGFTDEQINAIEKSADAIAGADCTGTDGQNIVSRSLKQVYIPRLGKCWQEWGQLPPSFQLDACLSACRQTADDPAIKNRDCLLEALNIAQVIFQTADLGQVQSWFGSGGLSGPVNLDQLHARIAQVYASGSDRDEDKLGLNQIGGMLAQNATFFKETLERLCQDPSPENDLTTAIKDGAFIAQKNDWNNMLHALYGVVAWHMFRQVQMAVVESFALV